MKKVLAIILVLLMTVAVFAGCAAPVVKTGVGQLTTIAKSKDVSEKDGAAVDGVAQVDTVMAAVTVDEKGKVLGVNIDTAQTKVTFDATGKITTADLKSEVKTKKELGKDYGMVKASKIGKEWFEQIAVVEKWMTGKTIDQIKAMKLKDTEGGKVTDEPDLVSSVTIKVEDYIKVVEEAVKNAK